MRHLFRIHPPINSCHTARTRIANTRTRNMYISWEWGPKWVLAFRVYLRSAVLGNLSGRKQAVICDVYNLNKMVKFNQIGFKAPYLDSWERWRKIDSQIWYGFRGNIKQYQQVFILKGRRNIQTQFELFIPIYQICSFNTILWMRLWTFCVGGIYCDERCAFMLLSPLKTSWWSTKEVNGTIQIAVEKKTWKERSLRLL